VEARHSSTTWYVRGFKCGPQSNNQQSRRHHYHIPTLAAERLSPHTHKHRVRPKMPATTAETLSLVTRNVSVAPLVLLSAADHYGRQAKGTRKRVVGVLLGQNDGKNVRVSNSFAGV
jgi:hypothetical protein